MSSDETTTILHYVINRNLSADENLTMSSNNTTDTPVPGNDPLITFTVPAIMFATGVFGNLMAIFVLLRSSVEHKQTVFYRLVGGLACTDLFGTCAISPVTLAVYANDMKWVGGAALCDYESFMMIFASCSTIFIISTMAVDRFVAINCPFIYDKYVSFERVKYCLLCLWGFAALMGLFPIIGLGDNVNQFPGTWCFFTFTSSVLKNKIYAYSYASIALVLIGVTAVFNVFVTFTLLKMRRKAVRTMNICSRKRNNSELQMMVLLLGIIAVFGTCYCPFLIRVIINQSQEKQSNVKADLQTLRLASINQILDPWVYILFRKEMFKRMIRCLREICVVPCLRLCSSSDSGTSASRALYKQRTGMMEDKENGTDPAGVFLQQDEQNHATNDFGDQTLGDESEPFTHRTNGVTKNSEQFCKRTSNRYSGISDAQTNGTLLPNTEDKLVPLQRSKSSSAKYLNRSSIFSRISDMLSDAGSDSSSCTTHKCNVSLDLKHSTCLFCLSKYPHDFVRATLEEDNNGQGSMSDKSSVVLLSRDSSARASDTVQRLSIDKRSSIHLSLSQLWPECESCAQDLRPSD